MQPLLYHCRSYDFLMVLLWCYFGHKIYTAYVALVLEQTTIECLDGTAFCVVVFKLVGRETGNRQANQAL